MQAVPNDTNDIAIILKYAQANKKRVVAKSGGHQYSGKSSGNQEVIVIDMHKFNNIKDL